MRDPRMGDLIERTIYNALFAAQSPDGRRLRYFAPTEGERVYWKTDTYCCPCNYRRIIAELPTMVFYHATNGVAVNLYTPSQAKLTVGSNVPLVLRQETDYPNSGRIRLQLEPAQPTEFTLHLRIPAWAKDASAAINGQAINKAIQSGTFLEITRRWQAGDEVTLELPMTWRLVKGRKRQAGRVAVMRGPQVFCLNPKEHEALAELDGAELGYLALDPKSLTAAIPSDAVRPGGIACKVSAWKPGFGLGDKGDYELLLTEFPDPDGRATYFRLRDFSAAVDDELLAVSSGVDAALAEPPVEKLFLWSERAPVGDGQFEATDASITVHRPAPEAANGAALVICPGGGYGGLVTGAEGHGIAAWLNAHGIAGIVLEYRLPKGRTLRTAPGCATSHSHGSRAREAVGHRPEPRRHHRLLRWRASGFHRRYPL